jgi:hypothetical protein
MEFQYKNALREYNVTEAELTDDAKTGIMQINQIQKSIKMLEARGKKPTKQALAKIKTFDKWVYYEILDYVNDTDKNSNEAPFEAEEIINELENKVDTLGLEVESELDKLFQSGTTKLSIEDIENDAPKSYKVIFDSYKDGEDNGIVTTKFSLLEKDDNYFHLNKN